MQPLPNAVLFAASLACVPAHGQPPLIASAIELNGIVGDVVVDQAGNAYVTGSFQYTITLGATTLYSGSFGGNEGFIAKLSPQGQWLWARRFGSSGGWDAGLAVATFPDGIVTVAARIGAAPSTTFMGTVMTVGMPTGLCIVRISTDGEFLGSAFAPGGDPERAVLAMGGDGAVYVGGVFQGAALNFGNAVCPGPYSAFFAALGLNNEWSWAKGFTGMHYAEVEDMVIDQVGNIVVLGSFTGPQLFMDDESFIGSPDSGDVAFWTMFTFKCSPTGNIHWRLQSAPLEWEHVKGYHLGLLPDGNYRVGGWYSGAVILGDISDEGMGADFVATLTPSGDWIALSAFQFGMNCVYSWFEDPACTTADGSYLVGAKAINQPTALEPWLLNPASGLTGTIAKWGASGGWLSAQTIPTTVISIPQGFASSVSRTLAFGRFRGETVFGATTLNAGNERSFIAELVPDIVGMRDALPGAGLRAYPNPTAGAVVVESPDGSILNTIRVFDATGVLVLEQPACAMRCTVDLSGLAPGMYMLRAASDVLPIVLE